MLRGRDALGVALEKSHAVFAARDDQSFEPQIAQRALAQFFELRDVGADARVIGSFEFGLVGSGGGDARVAIFEQAVARIERDALGA